MKSFVIFGLLTLCVVLRASACLGADANDLVGAWKAESIERGGELAPKEAVDLLQMTFTNDHVAIRGNFQDDREVTSKYWIDLSKNPYELTLKKNPGDLPVLAIFRFIEGKLQICARPDGKAGKRPTRFSTTKEDPDLVLVTFAKVK